ncbi:CopD family copper resistance protein [Pseudoxanthomonas koreensis]|uniref:CopD family copper resistance protein n=1 Tax=Pseudoxanthomonas koreensis TaxID=266061 RepID=UPI0035A6863D
MDHYALLLILHLFAALVFVGTVFFEVLILESVRKHVPRNVMLQIETAIGNRARQLMPWVLLVLYGSGLSMAWRYRALLAHPLESSFGLLLTLKIVLALSVFGHFLYAMALRRRRRLASTAFKRIHLSVFAHMVGIVLLAKLMFHLGW